MVKATLAESIAAAEEHPVGRGRKDGQGATPEKRSKVAFTRIGPTMHRELEKHAKRRGVGMADIVRLALAEWLAGRPELPGV